MTKPIKNSKLEINLEAEEKNPKEGFKVTLQKPSKIKKFGMHAEICIFAAPTIGPQ